MPVATKPIPRLSEKDKLRFFQKVSTIPTNKGCLEWMAGKVKDGYGSFSVGRSMFKSNRLAYFLATGEDPGELDVCHRCDNPPCCNPACLFLGTHKNNSDDMIKKGRANKARGDANGSRTKPERLARGDAHHSRVHPERLARGEAHGMAKLTEAQVIAIRADTRFQREIALDYGVDNSLISLIKRRKKWAHVG